MYWPNPDKAANRDSRRLWGIPLSSLRGQDLFPVPEEFAARPDRLIDLRKKLLPYAEEIEERYGYPRSLLKRSPYLVAYRESKRIIDDPDRLKEVSRRLPLNPYWSECSFDEIAKIAFGDIIQSTISDLFDRMAYERQERDEYGNWVEKEPIPEPFEFIYKLRNSLHHYGDYPSNWNDLVAAYYAIPEFQFGPDFEIRFDHTRYFNYWGRAFHIEEQIRDIEMPWEEKKKYWHYNDLYLDGVFAYLIYYKGRHVITLGFSLSSGKILLSQIQVRNQRGNRWLYRLPLNYFDYAVTVFTNHFKNHGFDTYLVDGTSLADRIASLYGDDHEIDPEAYKRIVKTYSVPLTYYYRGPKYNRKSMTYYKLLPVP